MRFERSWFYLLIGLVLLSLALTGSYAWATPEQAPNGQGTVPTARPRATAVPPTPIVTAAPGGGFVPMATATEPPATPQGAATSAPQNAATAAPQATDVPAVTLPPILGLTITGSRPVAWPGLTLQFTATLTNRGAGALSDLNLGLYLSDALAAGPQAAGAPGTWSGRTLQAALGDLAPGQQIEVPFSVAVLPAAQAGSVQQVMGIARAGGGVQVVVQTLIPMPPAELPITGDHLRF